MGTLLLTSAVVNINFTGGQFFMGETSSSSMTLKCVSMPSRMAPLDRTHTTSY